MLFLFLFSTTINPENTLVDWNKPQFIITFVKRGSFAEHIGLKYGDIIISINGKKIDSFDDLKNAFHSQNDYSSQMSIFRDSKIKTFKGKKSKKEAWGISISTIIKPRSLNQAEMREDLDTLFSAIMDIHPDPYFKISKKELESIKKRMYGFIRDLGTKSIDVLEFYKLLQKNVALIGDGHTSVSLPYPILNYYNYIMHCRIFLPLKIRIINNRIYIKRDLSNGKLKSGSEIISINNLSSQNIIENLLQFESGELNSFRKALVEKNFSQLLFTIYGFKNEYLLRIKSDQEETKPVELNAIDRERYRTESGLFDYDFHYEEKASLKMGIVRFNYFTDSVKFIVFLKNTFTSIKNDSIKYLIIDLRNNCGGNSRLAEKLLNYITDKPYRIFCGSRIKISKHYLKEYPDWKKSFGNVVDSIYTYRDNSMVTPPSNPLRFKGTLFVLTSGFTYSSASDFAAVIKYFKIGTLIGEETGDPPIHFGDYLEVELPNSHLTLNVSCKFFFSPNCDTVYINKGIIPDIEVETELKDFKKGIDPVMDKVKKIIKSHLND